MLVLQLPHNNKAKSVAGSSLLEQLVELREGQRKGGDRKEQGRRWGMWEGGLEDVLGRRQTDKDQCYNPKKTHMKMFTVL